MKTAETDSGMTSLRKDGVQNLLLREHVDLYHWRRSWERTEMWDVAGSEGSFSYDVDSKSVGTQQELSERWPEGGECCGLKHKTWPRQLPGRGWRPWTCRSSLKCNFIFLTALWRLGIKTEEEITWFDLALGILLERCRGKMRKQLSKKAVNSILRSALLWNTRKERAEIKEELKIKESWAEK